MSGRQWKPGDVALVNGKPMLFRQAPRPGSNLAHWRDAGGNIHSAVGRPLVVIDPEDREQVEALAEAVWSRDNGEEGVPCFQAALRSLVADPEPEPTGLGAVVEDADGREWVAFGNGCWIKSVPNAQLEFHGWNHIAAVRVLSPGYEADQ